MIDVLLVEMAIGGTYEMPDGRKFWIDGPTAREMARRVVEAEGKRYCFYCDAHTGLTLDCPKCGRKTQGDRP